MCGVPGLGCSVKNKYSYVPALQLWEDHSHHSHLSKNQSKKDNIQAAGQSQNLGEKIVSLLGLKRRNTMKAPESRVVSLPKVSVRRSVSSVTPKNKSGMSILIILDITLCLNIPEQSSRLDNVQLSSVSVLSSLIKDDPFRLNSLRQGDSSSWQ